MKKQGLIILTLVTAASVAGAAGSVLHRQQLINPPDLPKSLFPGLDEQINAVEKVIVNAPGDTKFSIVKKKGVWLVPEKGGYPVKFETVKQAVVGMADMQPKEAKTSRAKLFPKLQLGDPRKGGKGTRIELQGAGGKTITAGVLGRVTSSSTDTRIGWQYVRREGGARAWLAKARIQTWDNASKWLDTSMPTIARERIHIARSLPPGKDPIEVRHVKPNDRDFVFPTIPEGKQLIGITSPNSLGSALGFLSFDDVRPGKDVDFTKSDHVTEFETFDGLLIRLTLATHEGDTWVQFKAIPQADKRYDAALGADDKKLMKTNKAVAAEAKEINDRFGVWAYKLTKFKIKDLKTELEDITKPKEKK